MGRFGVGRVYGTCVVGVCPGVGGGPVVGGRVLLIYTPSEHFVDCAKCCSLELVYD